MLGFVEGEKPENPEKSLWSKARTQPTYGTGPESNPGHIDGRRAPIPASKHSLLNYFYLSYTISVFSFLHQKPHIVNGQGGVKRLHMLSV